MAQPLGMEPVGKFAAAILAALLVLTGPARAATLLVGPDAALKTPSAAAAEAVDGDTVEIVPGEYFDCAIWRADNLTIEGTGPGVVLTDKPCEGKAAFIIRGNAVTLRNLTFTRIRVPDQNGAGIRAEGRGLIVESSRFTNNQTGLLAGDNPASAVSVIDCDFTANGVRDIGPPSPALSVGAIATLRVERSRFADNRGGADILSSAGRTELIANHIEDGESGVRDALVVLANGGNLVMADNLLRRGPSGVRLNAAVHAYPGPAGVLELRANILLNASTRPAALLLDWSAGSTVLTANVLGRGDVERSTEGYWRHQTIAAARALYADARHLASADLRALRSIPH